MKASKNMKKIHAQEKKQFKKLLTQEGISNTEEHLRIFEVFLSTENHLTVDELMALTSENNISADRDLVKDALALMVQYGFAERKEFDDGVIRYEHCHTGLHHDHMICTKCNKIIEFTDEHLELLQDQIAKAYGFHMLLHKMEIYGICSDCREKQKNRYMSLDMVKSGQQMVIKDYAGGAKANMRFIDMGLRIGEKLEVITNSGKGVVVVALGFSRYALGRGMARKIIVEPADSK